MSSEILYCKGAKIWIPNADEVWEGATLEENYKCGDEILKVLQESGRQSELKIRPDGTDLPPLRNPAILVGLNDLTALSYLHEPGVLHNLRVRFCERQIIYTYCGIILVAINPYADLPLYGPNIIRAYRGRAIGELEPHIFALAEEAYAKLERENCDLSIIVSGESGAGKTVSAKYAMRYFAAVGGSESETQVERKVLASSPIMEAFGNAKTTRNDNSSRFGKFLKLLFRDDMGIMNLTGATMHTYLLEKSRVVFQSTGERNYHIFYQLCATRAEYPELILEHQDKFNYLNMGKSPDIERVSDEVQFKETLQAMSVLGFSTLQVTDVLTVLAGILHLGNIKFTPKYKKDSEEIDPDGCDIYHNDLHLRVTAELLKISADELRRWLIQRQIESVNELVFIPNTIKAAQSAKEALSKHIYAKLFQYIVNVINKCLNTGRKQASAFIGVLDIYGFETFEINSFEQFCINYANEKLQQQFNQHVFKLEQEEYLKEGIAWTKIDFYDNQPCIDLIESKLGVLDLLDEECRMPKGSDESWVVKLNEKCSKFLHFEKPRFGKTSFLIKHFSDTVEYEVNGFLEKNRDTVSKELVNVMRQSELSLCKQLMEMEEIDTLTADAAKRTTLGGRVVISPSRQQIMPSKPNRRTVGSQFRESLKSLIATLHATTPHYVRCIKPNDDKIAFKWETAKIIQQLRACGVLETVRISAAGFPSRWHYHDFYLRYQLLCRRADINKEHLKQTCRIIVQKWITDPEKYRFGNTQIFFRSGQVAYLEQIRADLRRKYIIVVQSLVRRFIQRRSYKRLLKIALGLQTRGRGFLARLKLQHLREERAALIISKYARGYLCRRRYLRLRHSVLGIQTYARGMIARKRFREAMDYHRAVQIQRFMRGYLARRAYHKRLRDIIICQAAIRRFLARRLFKRMKAEARTITHIQQKYKGLENKIIQQQQKIDQLNRDNANLKRKTSEISVLKMKLEVKKALEAEVKNLKGLVLSRDNLIESLNKQLEMERDERMQLFEEKARSESEWDNQKQIWRIENEELRKQLDEMLALAKETESKESMKRERLLSEFDTNEIHDAYQRALREKEIIENENYILKEELSRLQKSNGIIDHSNHRRTHSDISSQNGDDTGYVSGRNTLELNRSIAPPTEGAKDVDSLSSASGQTSLILKLRGILEEEKKKNKYLKANLEKLMNRNKVTEDSLRVSELEVENEKLRHDYKLLRNSIDHGVELHELNEQYNALDEELRRRRDECIQLKAVLQQQSQSLRSFGGESVSLKNNDINNIQENELIEAFQAQKLVNRQLESELSALTEENNAHFAQLTQQLDEIRSEKAQLQELLQSNLDITDDIDIEKLKQNERYLRFELEKTLVQYTNLQEEYNLVSHKLDRLKHGNDKLSLKLQERGIADLEPTPKSTKRNSLINVGKQKSQSYQGLMKFRSEDLDKITQRLIIGMTPRIAVNLLPGYSSYVIFMCIRYTDLINADDDVRDLLSKFVMQVKKFYRNPHPIEVRTLWLVNSITLLNLLKQYGDVEEYVKFNTEKQNQQQLKNFNLAEYRRVILELIMSLYQVLVRQIQMLLEPVIVPAILENEEIQPRRQGQVGVGGGIGGGSRSRSGAKGGDSPTKQQMPAWKQLISHLDYSAKQFHFFGLDPCYSEQVYQQLLYFICAVAINCLMLRGDICMWETGMIIRYNLGYIEDWVRERKMSHEVLAPLAPLNQVSQLLQSRKSEQDVQTICDLCTSLNTAQVLKVMKSYKSDDYEQEITNVFLEKLTKKLNERPMMKNDEFTMDQKFVYPFKVVYKHSDIKLEDIELAEPVELEGILEKI